MNNVIIIGGGASGLFAAINAANENNAVTVIEANEKMGKKILSTGNGRCNFSNSDSLDGKYNCKDNNFLSKVFSKYSNKDIVKSFEEMGVLTTDINGYLYPLSMQASTISDMLISRCRLLGVKFVNNAMVKDIFKLKDGNFKVDVSIKNQNDTDKNGKSDNNYGYNKAVGKINKKNAGENSATYYCNSIIISTGTKAGIKNNYCDNINKFLISNNHTLEKFKPALCGVEINKNNAVLRQFFNNTSGVRCKISASLIINGEKVTEEYGELQLTDYGLSGIVIFQLSSMISRAIEAENKAVISVDFIPEYNEEEIIKLADKILSQRFYEKKSLYDILNGVFNSKLSMELINLYSYRIDEGIKSFIKNLSKDSLVSILMFYKNVEFDVMKTNDFIKAQVCCGGINVDEINPETMESKYVKNLYFTGEVIDVDGKCGGYNLQWAWSTGYIAGRSNYTKLNGD